MDLDECIAIGFAPRSDSCMLSLKTDAIDCLSICADSRISNRVHTVFLGIRVQYPHGHCTKLRPIMRERSRSITGAVK